MGKFTLLGLIYTALLRQNPPEIDGDYERIRLDTATDTILVRYMGKVWRVAVTEEASM